MKNKLPKLSIRKLIPMVNDVARESHYRMIRKSIKRAKLQSGINKGKKSLYGGWNRYALNKHQSVLENATPQAKAFQNGYKTVAIQLIYNGEYKGWRTSQDKPGKKNAKLTKWMEKYKSDIATTIQDNGKGKTMQIHIPWNKFKVQDKAMSILYVKTIPGIRLNIKRGIKRNMKQDFRKYLLK